MSKKAIYIVIVFALIIFAGCKKSGGNAPVTPDPNFTVIAAKIDGKQVGSSNFASTTPIVKFSFSSKVDRNTANQNVQFGGPSGFPIQGQITYENNDSTIVLQPNGDLNALERYSATVNTGLKSVSGKFL